jgi:hopanoid biosynthesis associated radical SAM protein HpnJ
MQKRVFFLNPPSYEGFDGGAGSRYQAKREVRSFWYPTWLAQAAALCPYSRLVDAPANDMSPRQAIRAAAGFDLVIIYTSTPGFANDAKLARQFKRAYPNVMIGMVGPHCTVLPQESLERCRALDFVARREFDFTIADIAGGKVLSEVAGISFAAHGEIVHNPDRPLIENMDLTPSVLDVYQRDLTIDNYYVGYLLHPYLSVYTGRGCPGRCTFCLWPQTIGGRRYRARSVGSVVAEMFRAKRMFPTVKEFFFDDDTFTAQRKRAREIAASLKKLDVTWSCSTRADVDAKTLAIMKDGGLRCVMVGVESGSDVILQNIKKGITTDRMRLFFKDCRRLKIQTHATFVLGLPGETQATLEQTLQFAKELDPDTIQVSIASPYPGTELYEQALANEWMVKSDLVTDTGIQQVSLSYQNLTRTEIFDALEKFYNQFYFRARPILRILDKMMRDQETAKRRLREAFEFFSFMHNRKKT